MPISPAVRPSTPSTVWLARGRHVGSTAEAVLRRQLRLRKDDGAVQDFRELPASESSQGRRVFEARWQVPVDVTVRARLTVSDGAGQGQEWTLIAEAEAPWNHQWPSPADVFWPDQPDAGWDHATVAGVRVGDVTSLPEDDKDLRRVLRNCLRDGWSIHVVVHEAMTTDARGRLPLTRFLPAGLRHRVVEHRAAPQQLRAVNWALKESGVEVPRGGAVVLPGTPAPPDHDAHDLSVRTVFLDGSEPTGLIDAVTRFAALPKPLPEGGDEALTALREDWQLLTLEEELARERRLVVMYAEALEAMTKSRDLYREAAERANEALAAYRESSAANVPEQPSGKPVGSPLQQLTRTFERLRGTAKSPRLAPGADGTDGTDNGTEPEDR
ncbi:hypothetical protein [Streptomyces sp. HUAS ZL42]|uniref:hypothetical protein n=1 Tax=Streptomyces sp. HUAS ZL42 TaxID=3231715 RepID=UPI00345E71B1